MKRQTWALALAVGLLGAGGASQAALVDAGNGLVNDTVLGHHLGGGREPERPTRVG
jgi:hypothetical protein